MDKFILEKFSEWYEEAKNCKQVNDVTEVCIATADKNGRPSARYVLLKSYDERGFCFFTNYGGRKSKDLIQNPYAALCFYWNPLGKQIRIEGKVEKLSTKESDDYFNSRATDSKLGAWASKQSSELKSRDEFLNEIEKYKKQFEGKQIPRPEFWGGWRIVPDRVEFWVAEQYRYHRRELFEKLPDGSWTNRLLFP